jgi:predicted glycogen debranching enzyme
MHRDAQTLRDVDRALATEWLVADGAGGYASSTVLGCGTRRYHGLWVPALKPPVDRRVVLAHVQERLVTDRGEAYLSTCEYADGFHPDGFQAAERFELDPFPLFVSRGGEFTVEREVLLLRDGAGVCLNYRVRGPGRWMLEVAPFLAARPIHHLMHRHENFRVEAMPDACGFRFLAEGMPGVFLWTDARADVSVEPTWYYGVLRRTERERGFDHAEDLLAPGRWNVNGTGRAEWSLFCSFNPPRPMDVAAEKKRALARGRDLLARAGRPKDERLARLMLAADAFLVRRSVGGKDLATVIAGYHWFGDWGRDAMIALPGLAMETGRLDMAERVLEAFASSESDGLVPNRFAEETARPEYNTVDASLWFLQAVAAYVRAGGRADFVRERLWRVACDICERYRSGTHFDIRADADGLITAGSAGTQLTWMDAAVAGSPVTPRYGKAVEINALWISGLALMEDMADKLDLEAPSAAADGQRASQAFERVFWNEADGCLYDCVRPDGAPRTMMRPNQILAVGLPHAPLAGRRARAVVRRVRERLLTPRGLRTLAPSDPAYCGTYTGGPDERDAAYHRGTVWPWLLGPYVDAIFAVEDAACARAEAAQLLDGLLDSLDEAGLGQISEIFDGDPPHRPRGCIAQAWSVAAAIHVWRRLEAAGGRL